MRQQCSQVAHSAAEVMLRAAAAACATPRKRAQVCGHGVFLRGALVDQLNQGHVI
jgi:hypothetical protein